MWAYRWYLLVPAWTIARYTVDTWPIDLDQCWNMSMMEARLQMYRERSGR